MGRVQLLLGFKLAITMRLFIPFAVQVIALTRATAPYAVVLGIAFPFLSIFVSVFRTLPSAIVPPVPFKPTTTMLGTG